MDEEVSYVRLLPHEFEARLARAPIAYLPLGTLEWHGPHLPLGSDGLQSTGLFERVARKAGGIVLPMLFLGPDRREVVKDEDFYGMDIIGFPDGAPSKLTGSAYWVDDELFAGTLESILGLLRRAGFRIVVAHGHGPSTLLWRAHQAEWAERFGLKLFHCWLTNEHDPMGIQTDHAGTNETSLMMALHPQSVRLDLAPAPPEPIRAILGDDPRQFASPERGESIVSSHVEQLSAILARAVEELASEPGKMGNAG